MTANLHRIDSFANFVEEKANSVRVAYKIGARWEEEFQHRVDAETGMHMYGANLKREGRPRLNSLRSAKEQFTALWNSEVVANGVPLPVRVTMVWYVRRLVWEYKEFNGAEHNSVQLY